MSYLFAVLVVAGFTAIYVIGYKMNSKIKIDCDKSACEGCSVVGCFNRKDEGDK